MPIIRQREPRRGGDFRGPTAGHEKSPGPFRPRALGRYDSRSLAAEGHVRGTGPLGAVRDLEADLVTLVEGPETLGPDLGVVDEDVRTTLARQEPESLGLVEPLDGAFDPLRTGLLRPLLAASSPVRPNVSTAPIERPFPETTPVNGN